MNFSQGFFDSTVDAHGDVRLRDPMRLRGYINFRLLFWPNIYFTDATVNNNRILRDLMFENKDGLSGRYPFLPHDYNKLLKNKVIKIAVRSSLNDETFSSDLRKLQFNGQNLSLPDDEYTKQIENIISPDVIIRYDLNDVSRLFSDKVRKCLANSSNWIKPADEELQKLCERLYDEYQGCQLMKFNDLLDSVREYGYDQDDFMYKKIRTQLSECYKNNVPEILGLNNQHILRAPEPEIIDGRMNDIEMIYYSDENETVPVHFDIESLAYLPSGRILEILEMNSRKTFIEKLNRFVDRDRVGYNDVYTEFEKYITDLNMLCKDYFGSMRNKNNFFESCFHKMKSIKMKVFESSVYPVITYSISEAFEHLQLIADERWKPIEEIVKIFGIFILPAINMKKLSWEFDDGQKKLFAELANRSVVTTSQKID